MEQNRILVVDDAEVNRAILCELFKDKYQVLEAEDGVEAIEQIKKFRKSIRIILLDIMMPKMGGFEVIEELHKHNLMDKIPVVLVTSDQSCMMERKGYDLEVADVIRKPFDSCVVRRRVENLIDLYLHKNELELLVRRQTAEIRKKNQRLKEASDNIIETLSTMVEFRSLESGKHIIRIRDFTRVLLRHVAENYKEYNITPQLMETICSAASMHDIGKISIPDTILLKPGRLTKEEFEIMQTHTLRGCEIIEAMDWFDDEEKKKYCYEICRYHHERYDGGGYPDGLKGEEIPIAAQVVAIADVYEALVSKRVYKDAYLKEEAFQMILNGECGVFSPKLICCLKLAKKEFEELV